ncbi:hypothetical protein FFH21_015355 [Pseudomonas sp. KBS0707]|nr:hypothetical protein DND36_25480 [Pseudomonas savastanoi pv. glycinea]QDW01062.1 hypothetical protein FFH21_015355 [Pseudomonas sp. KBS0707]
MNASCDARRHNSAPHCNSREDAERPERHATRSVAR